VKKKSKCRRPSVFVQDLDSIPELLAVLKNLKNLSGLEINTTQTTGMWLSRWKNNLETPFDFRWPRDQIKAHAIFSIMIRLKHLS